MPATLDGQNKLFDRLPVQPAPDPIAGCAALLGPETRPEAGLAPAIREAACRRLLSEVRAWGRSDISDERLLSQLIAAADRNGYDFARNLERANWAGVDTELVEILDLYGVYADEIREAMTNVWVQANGITLDLEAGARVEDLRPRRRSPDARNAPRPGTVVGLRPDLAQYVVQFDDERVGLGPRDGEIVAAERLRRAG